MYLLVDNGNINIAELYACDLIIYAYVQPFRICFRIFFQFVWGSFSRINNFFYLILIKRIKYWVKSEEFFFHNALSPFPRPKENVKGCPCIYIPKYNIIFPFQACWVNFKSFRRKMKKRRLSFVAFLQKIFK